MRVVQTHRMAAWLLYGTSILTCSAQNQTNKTDISQCGSFNTLSPDAPVNSTGSMSFSWSERIQDWHFTTTFNDTRDPVLLEGIQNFGTWITVPQDTDTSICIYMLRPINATGTGDNGCDGILSQQCVDWLTENVKYDGWDDGSQIRCARSPYHEDVTKNCGEHVAFRALSGMSDLHTNTTTSINDIQVDQSTFPMTLAPFLHPQGTTCRMDTERMKCSE